MKRSTQILCATLAVIAALSVAGCGDNSMTVEGTPPNPDTHKDTRDMKSLPGATGGKPSPSSSPSAP